MSYGNLSVLDTWRLTALVVRYQLRTDNGRCTSWSESSFPAVWRHGKHCRSHGIVSAVYVSEQMRSRGIDAHCFLEFQYWRERAHPLLPKDCGSDCCRRQGPLADSASRDCGGQRQRKNANVLGPAKPARDGYWWLVLRGRQWLLGNVRG